MPPRLQCFAIQAALDGPGITKSLITEVNRSMKATGRINSASGRTAALAINWCERHKVDYTLTCQNERYFVQVMK